MDRGRLGIAVAVIVAALIAAAGAALFLSRQRPPGRPGPLDAAAVEPGPPSVSGPLAVWADRREGDAHYNVYLYDGRVGRTTRLTDDTAERTQPVVSGETVVWVDRSRGEGDIVRYDVGSGGASVLSAAPGRQLAPATDGAWVVWEDYRDGFAPAVYAKRLAGGPEQRVPAALQGAQSQPRIGAGFVVWQERGSFESSGAPAVFGYDLETLRPVRLSGPGVAAMLPDTDGTSAVWAQSNGRDLDVVSWDRRTGRRQQVAGGPGEQTLPVVSGGVAYWVSNLNRRLRVDTRRLDGGKARPLVSPSPPPQPAVDADGDSMAWLERTRGGWRVRGILPDAKVAPAGRNGAVAVSPFLPGPRASAVFDATPFLALGSAAAAEAPVPPSGPRARVEGTSAVEVSWTEQPGTTYEVFRSPTPMTAGALTGMTPVAVTNGARTVVAAAPGEIASAFTWYYVVRARSGAGGTAISENVAPDPHGTFGSPGVPTGSCRVCHFSRAGGLVPGARDQCYGCHGGTPGTSAYGAGSTLDAQASFGDDPAAPLAAGGSRHRNAAMTDTVRECDSCHTPHRKPADPDPARGFTWLLRTQLTASLADGAFRYNRASSPVGDAFCLDCHGRDATPITLVAGPTAYTDAGGMSETGWATSAHGRSVPAPDSDPGIGCETCHDPHASAVPRLLGRLDPRTGRSLLAGSQLTGNDRSVCYGCHAGASADYPVPSRDASGYPLTGVWPGRAVYDAAWDASTHAGGIHARAAVVWPGTDYAGGACQNCHALHGPTAPHDILRNTDAAGETGAYTYTPADFSFCFACHATGSPGAWGIAAFYPQAAGGSGPVWPNAGHATTSPGTLPAGSALPCYGCHDPHGSAASYGLRVVTQTDATTTLVLGDESAELTMTPARSATDVRHFCLACHTTSDATAGAPLGWNGSALASVAPGAAVVGIDRTAGLLRLRDRAGHESTSTASCYGCHGDDYRGSGGNVHAPAPGSAPAPPPAGPETTAPPGEPSTSTPGTASP